MILKVGYKASHMNNSETNNSPGRVSRRTAVLFILFFAAALMLAGTIAYAYGLEATAAHAGLKRSDSPPQILGNVIGAALSLVGVFFFILTIYAGLTWMWARGNEEQSKKALNTIIAAVIGLIIVLASYAITNFVLTSVGSGSAGTSGPAVTCESNSTDTQTYACQNISGCSGIAEGVADMNDEQQVAACNENETCLVGLCSGGTDNVCCVAG